MSLYDEIKKQSRLDPNAVCMWCSDHYVPKDKYCYSYGKNIHDPLMPKRCPRYTGEPVTKENLESVWELLRARLIRS